MTWSNQGPGNRRIMFYAANADGTLAESGSTANGYGHWFNASGTVCPYSAGHIFSEFSPSSLTFTSDSILADVPSARSTRSDRHSDIAKRLQSMPQPCLYSTSRLPMLPLSR